MGPERGPAPPVELLSECVCWYPAALLLAAVGVAVQAGEDGARRHQLAGLVPAVRVAEPGGVALTLPVQHGVQSEGAKPLLNRLLLYGSQRDQITFTFRK